MIAALDARLGAAAQFVRQGASFADIGSDHAYLPIFLLREGRITRAVVTDVAVGPLSRARRNLLQEGFMDRAELVQTDGLAALAGCGLTDIAICGMGGELIVRLLEAASFVRDPQVRLILQPMSRPADLRLWLAREGFAIEEEVLCTAGGRIYFCICASYTAHPYTLTPLEAEFGACNLLRHPPDPLLIPLARRQWTTWMRKIEGMERGGLDASEQRALADALYPYCRMEVDHDGT